MHMAHLRAAYSARHAVAAARVVAASPLPTLCSQIRPRYFTKSSFRPLSTHWIPTVLQPDFWRSLVPKPFKSDSARNDTSVAAPKGRDWNPATFFIIIFLLIGSQAIQILSLHRNFDNFSRDTEAKLNVLRRVVEKIRNGEDVDVKRELGTGDPKSEKQWKEVIRELEEEDAMIQSRRKRRELRRAEEQGADAPSDKADKSDGS